MRVIAGVVFLLFLLCPAIASSQSVQLQGSAGSTFTGAGCSLAAGIGFTPTSRLAFLVEFDRTHVPTRERRDGQIVSRTRGGTLTFATVQLQARLFGRDRIGPYGLAGLAAGVSRLNVNETFPDRVTNDARAVFLGGGLHVPLGERISLFADGRFMLGTEGPGGILAVAPIRAGLAWHF